MKNHTIQGLCQGEHKSASLDDEKQTARAAQNRLTVLKSQHKARRLEIVRERKGRRAERPALLDGDERFRLHRLLVGERRSVTRDRHVRRERLPRQSGQRRTLLLRGAQLRRRAQPRRPVDPEPHLFAVRAQQ